MLSSLTKLSALVFSLALPFCLPVPSLAQEVSSDKAPEGMWTNAKTFVPDPAHLPLTIWPGLPPDAAANASLETSQAGKGNRVRGITIPTLIPYFLPQKPTHGAAIIYCPGGGYGYVAVGGPGNGMADKLNAQGITMFVLMYRQKGAKKANELAFEDGQRAVRYVRSHAAEWGLDPNKIGLAGTSAGANLTFNMVANSDKPAVHPPSEDAVDAVSARPDFAILISFWAGHSSESPYKAVKDSPPTFVGHAKNDHLAMIGVSVDVNKQMTDLGIPVLYKEYDTGGHGLRGVPWMDDCLPWLRSLGKLDPAPPVSALAPAATTPAANAASTNAPATSTPPAKSGDEPEN